MYLDKITLSITSPTHTHLIHVWHTRDEFERGVRILWLEIAKELIQPLPPGRGPYTRKVITRRKGREVAPLWRVEV